MLEIHVDQWKEVIYGLSNLAYLTSLYEKRSITQYLELLSLWFPYRIFYCKLTLSTDVYIVYFIAMVMHALSGMQSRESHLIQKRRW